MCELECLRDKGNPSVLLDNVDFCNVDELPLVDFNIDFVIERLWRWLPAGDDFVDLFLSRDSDFCIVEREQAAVYEWLEKNTIFHIIRGEISKLVFFKNSYLIALISFYFTRSSRS